MHPDSLVSLRAALLLSVGLGGCASPARVEPGPSAEQVEPVAVTEPSKALPPKSSPTGRVREADGAVHRAGPETCSAEQVVPPCTLEHPNLSCTSDAQCTKHPHGKCTQMPAPPSGDICTCVYSCANDSECPSGEACTCGGPGQPGQCVAANCKSDGDCASGTCSLTMDSSSCSHEARFACRTDKDTCKSNEDCNGGLCDSQGGAFGCHPKVVCIPGRPLLVDGVARMAPRTAGDAWLADLDITAELSDEVTLALADHWAEIAALEHASVASFARFTLELLAHAAPPELLLEASRAALDEVEHARVAWSLASRFAGRALGPGPLALDGALAVRDVEAMVVALVREGCVGETLGAAEVRWLAADADPALAPVLRTIADDEQRHAALAWKTLRWLLAVHGPRVRQAALAAIDEVEVELAREVPSAPRPEAPAWGLGAAAALDEHRREAFATVVRPVLHALLAAA